MGWSIYYEVTNPQVLTDGEVQWIEKHVEKWNKIISERSEPYYWSLGALPSKLQGVSKIAFAEDPSKEFNIFIEALQEFEKHFKELEVGIADDFLLADLTSPTTLGDPSHALEMLEKKYADIYQQDT